MALVVPEEDVVRLRQRLGDLPEDPRQRHRLEELVSVLKTRRAPHAQHVARPFDVAQRDQPAFRQPGEQCGSRREFLTEPVNGRVAQVGQAAQQLGLLGSARKQSLAAVFDVEVGGGRGRGG